MVNKIKEKIKNNKVLIIVLISFLAIILGVGISYAFYAAIIKGNETSTTLQLDAGTLSINYDGGETIIAKDFLPGDQPFATKTFTLTGNNDSDLYMPYIVSLVVDANTFNSGSLRYSFSGENTSNNGKIIDEHSSLIGDGLEFGPGYFAPGATNAIHTYTFNFYFPDDGTNQSDEMNRVFEAHIKIEGAKISTNIPESDSDTFIAGSLASEIVGGNALTKVNANYITEPGVDAASTDEGVLAAPDDFGTSYYYRGVLNNNYLMFANKCWRIIRVMGDGNVKITLANDNGSCSGVTGSSAYYGGSTPYHVSGTIPDFKDTSVYSILSNFYNALGASDKAKVVDSIWCQDKTLINGYYISDYRLMNSQVSYLCSDSTGANINEYRNTLTSGSISNGNKALPYSIGLLTSDEIVYSGAIATDTISTTYLSDESSERLFVSMSPGNPIDATPIYIYSDGGMDSVAYGGSENIYYVRPTLVLNGKLSVTGSGTKSNPYSV